MRKPQGDGKPLLGKIEKGIWITALGMLAILVAPIPRSTGGDGYYAAPPAEIIVDGNPSCYYAPVVTKDGNDSLYRRLIGERASSLAAIDDLDGGREVHESAEAAAWGFIGYAENKIELPGALKQSTSAGLAMTLALIDANTKGNLLPDGQCVAATGVIGRDGTVYEIGGVESKAKGVRESGITLLFIPVGNAVRENKEGLTVVPILTVTQAIAYLCDLGGDDEICETLT